MKKNTYRFILLLLGILLFLTISMGINFSSSLNGTLELPDAIESLSPMPGSQVPQQTTIEIDMPIGYEIVLYIDDYRVSDSEIEHLEGTGIYRWRPGPGKSFESWGPGKHKIKIVWDTSVGLPDIGEFTWEFSTY